MSEIGRPLRFRDIHGPEDHFNVQSASDREYLRECFREAADFREEHGYSLEYSNAFPTAKQRAEQDEQMARALKHQQEWDEKERANLKTLSPEECGRKIASRIDCLTWHRSHPIGGGFPAWVAQALNWWKTEASRV